MANVLLTTLIDAPRLARLRAEDTAGPLLFDCRFDLANPQAGEQAYAAGHLPGAFYLHLERDMSGKPDGHNGRHPLPDRATLSHTLQRLGLTPGRQVVAYDAQGGIFAARLWWLLRWLGYEAVAVLDGGIEAWRAAGFDLTTDTPVPAPGDFKAGAPLVQTIDVAPLEDVVARRERLIVDARAPDRFRGENETLDPVGGHIPGAVNHFFKDNLGADGRFKRAQDLHADFSALFGATPPQQTVMQCGSGVTACHNLLALEIAGLPGAVLYPGSWSEWCADARRPVATGPDR